MKRKLIWCTIGTSMLCGLLGITPKMYIVASTAPSPNLDTLSFQNTSWKSITIISTVKDTLTIEERIQRIEEMMAIDSNLMTKSSIRNDSSNMQHKLSKWNEATISDNGKKFIKQYESCSLTAYKLKGESRYTIGYGHVIYDDNIPHKISKKYADELFNKDIEKYNSIARDMLGELDHRFTYSQGFIDGFVSLIYNCGPTGVKKTRFWSRMKACRYDKENHCINKKDLVYAIEAVKSANISRCYANGHKNRRKAEHSKMAS